jgi:AraC family transcriptional regulator, regulatory protein of adaptative response / methylated-DNA-[protein]-cysteine methyltransferase
MRISYTLFDTSLGLTLLAATDVGVCALLFADDGEELESDLRRRFPEAEITRVEPTNRAVRVAVKAVAADIHAAERLPLHLLGTPFQCAVWKTLRRIPAGKTLSYSELAEKLGKPSGARAVASACGANHIAVAVPCHRVVAADGSLGGYRWGVERKRELLALETLETTEADTE